MVRRSLNGSKSVSYIERGESDEEADDSTQEEEEEQEERPLKKSGGKRKSGKRSPKKKKKPSRESSDEEKEEEEEGSESDASLKEEDDIPLKKRKVSTTPSSKKKKNPPKKASPRKVVKEDSSEEDNQEEEEGEEDEQEEDEEEEEEEEESYSPKKRFQASNGSAKKKGKKLRVLAKRDVSSDSEQEEKRLQKNGKLPPVSQMVTESIKAMKDNPKVGSSFSSIKSTILLNWPVEMDSFVGKIKRYMETAEKNGDIIRTKGKGFNARFTVPGMRRKKVKPKSKMGKKFDTDEVEYVPTKTARDEERMKDKEELERRREERAQQLEKTLQEKAARPKVVKPKKEFFEVQSIQGTKIKEGINYYLVKYEGSSKAQWEPEENVQNCWDLVEMFLKEDELRKDEIDKMRKEWEEKGEYEVQRILEVKYKKQGKKEFLIRWKGYSANEDSWENEEDLNCPELIEAFLEKVEFTKSLNQKSLRVAPKKIDRLAFTNSKRLNKCKRTGGFRVTYEDME